MISNFSSSLFNLGIILIIFSAIVYIVKSKLSEMDKKINSLSNIVESMAKLINNRGPPRSNLTAPTITSKMYPKPVVSDDESDDESDDDNDDNDDVSDDDDENEPGTDGDNGNVVNNNNDPITNIDIDGEDDTVVTQEAVAASDDAGYDSETISVSELLPSLSNPMESNVKSVDLKNLNETGNDIRSFLSNELPIPEDTRNVSIKNDEPDVTLLTDLTLKVEKKDADYNEPDLNTLNVRELKKMVSQKGGKVSDKKKEDLIEFLMNNQ